MVLMLLPILFASVSLVFFFIGLWRFPFGSFQNIIILLLAALFMYMAISVYQIPQVVQVVSVSPYNVITTGTTNTITQYPGYNTTTYTSPINTRTLPLMWEFVYIYDVVLIIFALIGLLFRLTGRLS